MDRPLSEAVAERPRHGALGQPRVRRTVLRRHTHRRRPLGRSARGSHVVMAQHHGCDRTVARGERWTPWP